MKIEENLVVKKVKYVESKVDIEDNAVYKKVYSINPNGRVVINDYKRVLDGNPNAETDNINTFEYMGDTKMIAKFISKELEIINNAKTIVDPNDDASGFIELTFEHDTMDIRADRCVSDGKKTVYEIFSLFFKGE